MKIRNIFSLFVTLLLCCMAVLACAASKKEWQNAQGSYVWTESSQFNNGILNIMPLENDLYLYEFKVVRGSEEEDSTEEFQTAGIFTINEEGDGIAEVRYQDNDIVEIRFVLNNNVIAAYQDGPLPLDIQGDYKHNEDTFDVSENAAVALIESLTPAVTSLTSANRPYKLVYADETVDGWFYQVTAVHEPSDTVIAKYLVAADLSAVYRNDDGIDEPGLIYGSPLNMLAAQRAPLVEENEIEAPAIENGEQEGDVEEKEAGSEDEAQLSPLVAIAPEQESLRMGEKTKIVAQLPGDIGYSIANLVSQDDKILRVTGDNELEGLAPGTVKVRGKLHLEKGEKAFETKITVYEPVLEADNLPTHLEIGEKLVLNTFITGEEGNVKADWSISDEKIATIENGKLVGKADGVAKVTAKHGELTRSWYVAVGNAELPMGAIDSEDEEDEDSSLGFLTIIAVVVILGAGALWFLRRKK